MVSVLWRFHCTTVANCTFCHGCVLYAGINCAAMFQECLEVLRSIVLHSLGIKKDVSLTSQDLHRDTAVQNIFNQTGVHPHQVSPQTATAPIEVTSEESESVSPDKSTQVKKASPRNNLMTPSLYSRLSSGFGSLQDEEGSINYESSNDQKCNDTGKNRDSNCSDNIEQVSHVYKKKEHKKHKHHRHRSYDRASIERHTNHTTLSPRYDKNISPHVQGRENYSSVPPPRRAWYSTEPTHVVHESLPRATVQSVRTSSDAQSLQSYSQKPVEKNSMQSPPLQTGTLSPRAKKQRQRFHSKQLEVFRSKDEKQRLESEVNLLNLKVVEEDTK